MTDAPAPDIADWIMEIFTRPATEDDYFLSPDLDPPPGTALDFATRLDALLAAPGTLLAPYDDLAVAAGLRWIFDSAETEMFRSVGAEAVPQALRLSLLDGIGRLFREVFATRCSEALGHRSEPSGPLNTTCYMFWDNLYLDPPARAEEWREMQAAMAAAMTRILAFPHAACQEAALHGMGHWLEADPEGIARAIDAYLAKGRAARPELVAYAQAARTGCVL